MTEKEREYKERYQLLLKKYQRAMVREAILHGQIRDMEFEINRLNSLHETYQRL